MTRRILYVDCFAGAAGDMMLGALLDLGLPEAHLQERLQVLGPLGYTLRARRTLRHGISAVDVTVDTGGAAAASPAPPVHSHSHAHGHSHSHAHGHSHSHAAAPALVELPATTVVRPPGVGVLGLGESVRALPPQDAGEVPHRPWREIRALIENAALTAEERELSLRIFARLAAAEGRLHGMPADDVEFHEVGGVDAIVDIVGTAIGLAWLRPDAVVVAPIPTPRGFVRCAHGLMPLPAPATLELLRGAETQPCRFEGEWVTPTGAAILTAVATDYGPIPAMRVDAIGYGAGDRDPETHPNLLRLVFGHAPEALGQDVILETNIDDMSPELYGHLVERLFDAGALDVWLTAIQMKKGRPATQLSVLSPPERRAALERVVLTESTAIGLRRSPVERHKATRVSRSVDTPWGPVRVKEARDGATVLGRVPEYEDCRTVALASGQPLKVVMAAAAEAASRLSTGE